MKERNCGINTGVNARQREGGIMDIKQRKLQLLPLNLNRCTCKMVRNLSLSSGKNREMICCRRYRKFKYN